MSGITLLSRNPLSYLSTWVMWAVGAHVIIVVLAFQWESPGLTTTISMQNSDHPTRSSSRRWWPHYQHHCCSQHHCPYTHQADTSYQLRTPSRSGNSDVAGYDGSAISTAGWEQRVETAVQFCLPTPPSATPTQARSGLHATFYSIVLSKFRAFTNIIFNNNSYALSYKVIFALKSSLLKW